MMRYILAIVVLLVFLFAGAALVSRASGKEAQKENPFTIGWQGSTVKRWHDPELPVTCWWVYQNTLSCLPDSQIKAEKTP